MSQQTKSHTGPLPALEIAALLRSARDAMLDLGKSRLGDKTIIDSVDAVAASIDGLASWPDIAAATVDEAGSVLTRFRGRPCRVGRARKWPEKSQSLDDPGMVAFEALLRAIVLPASWSKNELAKNCPSREFR